MILVIVRDPDQPARVERIEPTLAEFQRLVGGNIECVSMGRTLGAYVNEDGVRLGLRPNVTLRARGDVVAGPIVLSRADATGEDIGVDNDEVEALRAMLDAWAVVEVEA
jgi:hypothetical protein